MLKIIAVTFSSLLTIISYAQSVKVKTIKETDFKQFETFTINMGDFAISGEDDRKISNQEFHEKLKGFVKNDLESKGYQFTEDSTADFVIDYVASVFNLDQSENLGPLGGTPATGPGDVDQSRYWSKNYREGLLVLEIYRGNRNNLLWTSESKMDLTDINPDRALSAIVVKSFKKFPKKNSKKK
jgi:hypothetical protein